MINSESSLAAFQENNNNIYLVTNDRNYSIEKISARLHRHITQVLKAVRKEKYDNIAYHLCMSLSWSFAAFNRFHINLAEDMWKRFPGLCPYCLEAPCCCKQRPRERQKLGGKYRGKQPVLLRDWQQMFAGIYPNVVLVSAIHLAEEAGEVDEALQAYSATHQEDWFWKAVEEFVDVVTNIFGVANCLNLDLAARMAEYFSNGCPKCHHSPCECGFLAAD